jgi:hypothetical protein
MNPRKILDLTTLLLSSISLVSPAMAKEVDLLCKGKEEWTLIKDNGPDSQTQDKTYEVTFDDEKRTIPSMTIGLIEGCFESDYYKSTKCDCSVTDKIIKCEAETTGIINPTIKSKQEFSINRLTGRMLTFRSYSGKDFHSGVSGELSCEVFTKKKF